MLENIALVKKLLRAALLEKRGQITAVRKSLAAKSALSFLSNQLATHANILSFSSLPEEIDLKQFNEKLAHEKKLLLPRVDAENLRFFAVANLKTQLRLSRWHILEPDPEKCREVFIQELTCVLVPGLAFDRSGNRLGYGKGLYDRLLAKLANVNSTTQVFGVALQEQLFTENLPSEEHDQKVTRVLFF